MSFLDRLKMRTRSAPDVRNKKSDRLEELWALVRERPDDWTTENELADALAQHGRVDEAVTRLCGIADRLSADGWVAKAHAIYKKVLRLRPQDQYALSRAATLNAERINQQGFRFGVSGEAPTTEAVAPGGSAEACDPNLRTGDGDERAESGCVDDASAAVDSGDFVDVELHEEAAGASSDGAVPEMIEAISNDEPPATTDAAANRTVETLMEFARMHPEQIEPVARLAEVAAMSGLDDVRDDAEARLCDLHYRRGDFHAARAVAEGLVARHPDDPRHRARLEFLAAELEDHEAIDEGAGVTESIVTEASEPTDARAALERGVEEEQSCFAAARQLARIDAESGNWASALAWLERAASAVATPADEEDLAYEMALVLENAGEVDRALGVLHEIAAQTGAEYRDVSERILRLTSAHAPLRQELVAV